MSIYFTKGQSLKMGLPFHTLNRKGLLHTSSLAVIGHPDADKYQPGDIVLKGTAFAGWWAITNTFKLK